MSDGHTYHTVVLHVVTNIEDVHTVDDYALIPEHGDKLTLGLANGTIEITAVPDTPVRHCRSYDAEMLDGYTVDHRSVSCVRCNYLEVTQPQGITMLDILTSMLAHENKVHRTQGTS